MRRRPLLACALLLGGLAAAQASALPSGAPGVSAPVLVTGATPFPASCSSEGWQDFVGVESEVSLAVSPRDPSKLATTYMQDDVVGHPVSRSSDGGQTWQTTVPAGPTQCSGGDGTAYGVFDPWISYGADGRLYLLSVSSGESTSTGDQVSRHAGIQDILARHIYIHTSDDDGATWQGPFVAGGDVDNGFVLDKPSITADRLRPGHAYAVWTRINLPTGTAVLGYARSTDGGRTWTEPAQAPLPLGTRGVLLAPEIHVLPNGDLTLLVAEARPATLFLAGGIVPGYAQTGLPRQTGQSRFLTLRSTDAGLTWSREPALVGKVKLFPAVATGAVAPDGTMYAVWSTDQSTSDSAVMLATSPDGGRTWGAPQTLVAPSRRAITPAVAVDGTGAIAVTWYDGGASRWLARAFVAVSRDRGRTWAERNMSPTFDLNTAPATNNAGSAYQMGDYEGLVGLPGGGFVATYAVARPIAQHGATDVVATRITLP